MAELGDHDQDPLLGLAVEAELHVEPAGDGCEFFFEHGRRVVGGSRERGAQVQGFAEAVVELLVFVDVEATLEEERGHGLDDPGLLLARQGQHELLRLLVLERRQGAGCCGCFDEGHVPPPSRYIQKHGTDILD